LLVSIIVWVYAETPAYLGEDIVDKKIYKIMSINKRPRLKLACRNVCQVGETEQSEAVKINNDFIKKYISPINIEPYISLQEHKEDIVAVAMAGGDPTDLYPVEAYCLPGEHQKILSWLKKFNVLWNSISVSQTVINIFVKKNLDILGGCNEPNYIRCCKVFKLMNESPVHPESTNILFWHKYLQKYGAD